MRSARRSEVDTQGDAFFFAFATAPAALAAAADLTEALMSGPVRVRVGLHTGTPLLSDEGYVGIDVHRAARIAASGHGGQVLVSQATASLVDGDLRDLGEHRFKDLLAPGRVYQLGSRDFPPLRSLGRTNLPVAAWPLLGRERELAEIRALLAGGCDSSLSPDQGGRGRHGWWCRPRRSSRRDSVTGLGLASLGLGQRDEARAAFAEMLELALAATKTHSPVVAGALSGIALAAEPAAADRAARLRGAVARLSSDADVDMNAYFRAEDELDGYFEREIAALLGDDAWEREKTAGATMTLEQAIELARSLSGRSERVVVPES